MGGRLQTNTLTNTGSFSFWESPMFAVGTGTPIGKNTIAIGGQTGPNSLFRSTWTIQTSETSPTLVPTVRVRSSSFDFQIADELVIASQSGGAYAPTPGGDTYVQYFSQPETDDQFRLDFDVINFDPTDTAATSLFLDEVLVEYIGLDYLGIPVAGASLDFTGANANGFTAGSAVDLDVPQFFGVADEGLAIRGTNPIPARQDETYDPSANTMFGFYTNTTDMVLSQGMYSVSWTVNSDVAVADRLSVPSFRFRVNDSSFQFASVQQIESLRNTARIPSDGVAEVYTQFFEVPADIAGNNMILSFDYLYSEFSDNDPTVTLYLESLQIATYPGAGPGK
jgi:hypothetical protein